MSTTKKVLVHTVIIPSTYAPPDDVSARFAAWLVRETSLYPERIRDRFWIPLSENAGRRLFGGNWYRAVTSAVETGLAERHHSYSTGRVENGRKASVPYCKAIRLCKKHLSASAKAYSLRRSVVKETSYNLSDVGTWLAQWLPEFDLPPDVRPTSLWTACHIEAIRAKLFYATQCLQGRFHSNFTTMSKANRARLTHKEHTLTRLDIQCSQPTLLDAMLIEPRKSRSTQDSYTLICHTSTDFYECLLPIARECEDFWDAKTTAPIPGNSSRKQRQVSLNKRQPSQFNRNDIKVNLLKSLFAKNATMVRQPAFVALENLYPAHADFIKDAKRKDHRILAQSLQRLESSIIIDGVCGHLSKHYPDTPVLTIHDELIVPQNMADIVLQLILAEFDKHGVRAKVLIENLSPS